MTNMSQYNSVSSEFQPNWPDWIRSNKEQLDEIQRLGKFISDLGKELCMYVFLLYFVSFYLWKYISRTDQSVYTAIQIVCRFFRVPTDQKYDLPVCFQIKNNWFWFLYIFFFSVIWQAAVFLACKIQDNARWRQEIYESAAKVYWYRHWVCTEKQKKLKIKQNLFLDLEVSACHPYEDIDKAIEKISSKYKNLFLKIENWR